MIIYVPDVTARLVALTSGEVDGAFLEPQQAARVRQDDQLRLLISQADYRPLMFNMAQPAFEGPRVRQAMNYAVDRKALADIVLLERPPHSRCRSRPATSRSGSAGRPRRRHWWDGARRCARHVRPGRSLRPGRSRLNPDVMFLCISTLTGRTRSA